MNTGNRNVYGRSVFQGPRGGRYVMVGARKVYKFQLAPAAAAGAGAGAAAGPAVPRNIHGRQIHTGPRGGRYVMVGARKVYKFEEAPAAPPAPPPPPPGSPPGPAGTIRVPGTQYYIHKNGRIVTRTNEPVMLSGPSRIQHYRNVFNKDPNHLHNRVLPFKNTTTHPLLVKSGLRARPTRTSIFGYPAMEVPIFFDRTTGNLFYIRQDNLPVHVQSDAATHYGIQVRTNATLRQMKQELEATNARYPRSRTNAQLLNLMVNRIYGGAGRAGTINVSNLTANEKRRVAERLRGQVSAAIHFRNKKQREANQARTRGNFAAAAAANERAGYFNNISRAMRRGLRAVEPLSGHITGARITAATPNRWTPGGPNETNVVMMENLERPHIIIKVPGTQVLYMNPNSLIGMIKNGTGANVAKANLRNWLRMARRNFPNEPLFRHYISRNKNVTPRHIRFSRN